MAISLSSEFDSYFRFENYLSSSQDILFCHLANTLTHCVHFWQIIVKLIAVKSVGKRKKRDKVNWMKWSGWKVSPAYGYRCHHFYNTPGICSHYITQQDKGKQVLVYYNPIMCEAIQNCSNSSHCPCEVFTIPGKIYEANYIFLLGDISSFICQNIFSGLTLSWWYKWR